MMSQVKVTGLNPIHSNERKNGDGTGIEPATSSLRTRRKI